ncbi:MAG: hypothetical protein RQ736_02250 [Thiogranum sp.]|nr:hypothetical protein [Thiogranum sp.]
MIFAGLLFLLFAHASSAEQTAWRIDYPLGSPYYPVVLNAAALPFLVNAQANWVSLYAESQGRLEPIPFQIDKVDRRGRYEFASSETEKREEARARIVAGDEVTFMVGDLGGRWSGSPSAAEPLREVRLVDPETGVSRWLYVRIGQRRDRSGGDYVQYQTDGDFIAGHSYRVGFADDVPFLLDHLQRRQSPQQPWSDNLVDSMKVLHRGSFLHKFAFVRSHRDYQSRVVAVKDGPVRVIRRTLNNVRMILFLKTPNIEVDFVAYGNSFYVDTLLDIPFRIGSIFSGLDTRFSIDWREDVGLEGARLYTSSVAAGVAVDGEMSQEEYALNQKQDDLLLFSSRYGDMLVTLGIPEDLPVGFRNFYHDDRAVSDRPETVQGQFGNFGFLTDNWESLNTDLHHLMFHAYLTPAVDSAAALQMLRRAPSFGGQSPQR